MFGICTCLCLEAGKRLGATIELQIKEMFRVIKSMWVGLAHTNEGVGLDPHTLAVAVRRDGLGREGEESRPSRELGDFERGGVCYRSRKCGLCAHYVQLVLEGKRRYVSALVHRLPADGGIVDQAAFAV